MGYEVDFLAIGSDSKSGDAIVVRYGDLAGLRSAQRIIVIDGGYVEDGQKVVDHIATHYHSDSVDLVVSTHPDQDHIGGLKTVIDDLQVGELWMHLPSQHSLSLAEARPHAYATKSFSESLTKSLKGADDLEARARAKGIPIREPFAGLWTEDGAFGVLGPTSERYEKLLGELKPAAGTAAVLGEALRKAAEALANLVPETIWIETLTDSGTVSPQNNSSAVCALIIDGRRILFTADAGIEALNQVADTVEAAGWPPGSFNFVQLPHHGSRRNVGPTVLNRILGPKGQSTTSSTAFVSAAPGAAPKHPAKKVTNAFRRRGYNVVGTLGEGICHSHDAPNRPDWGPATPIPFYGEVDESETE